jgi:hypothetical protein
MQSKSPYITGMAIITMLIVIAFFCIVFPEKFQTIQSVIPLIIMALAAGLVVKSPSDAFSSKTDTSRIGLLGLSFVIAISILGLAIAAFIAAFLGYTRVALGVDVVVVGLWLLSLLLLTTTAEHLNKEDTQRNRISPHLNWMDRLSAAADTIKDYENRAKLKILDEDCRYLARRTEIPLEINDKIDAQICWLEKNKDSDPVDFVNMLSSLKVLFQERERILNAKRRTG